MKSISRRASTLRRRHGRDDIFRTLNPVVYTLRRALSDGTLLDPATDAARAIDPKFDLMHALQEPFSKSLCGSRFASLIQRDDRAKASSPAPLTQTLRHELKLLKARVPVHAPFAASAGVLSHPLPCPARILVYQRRGGFR
jgi:hypothetical protein